MKNVVDNIDAIGTKCKSVNDHLAEKRGKVDKLVGVRRLLNRFEFLFELPERLNR